MQPAGGAAGGADLPAPAVRLVCSADLDAAGGRDGRAFGLTCENSSLIYWHKTLRVRRTAPSRIIDGGRDTVGHADGFVSIAPSAACFPSVEMRQLPPNVWLDNSQHMAKWLGTLGGRCVDNRVVVHTDNSIPQAFALGVKEG